MEKSKNYIFYVLECKDGSYYAGYTTDMTRRLTIHNAGKGAKYTRARLPVTLLFNKSYETKSEALKMEASFKKLTRVQKEAFLKENEDVYSKKLPK